MSKSMRNSGYFSVSSIGKMFSADVSKTSILNYEERGVLPRAKRIMRGRSAYRVWELGSLPRIGEAIGFLKKPKVPKVVAVFSLKGGTGKTTFAFQMARILALHNIRTLVIGLDAQESISQTLNRAPREGSEPETGLFHVLADSVDIFKSIAETDLPTLRYLPETIELSVLDRVLKGKMRKEYVIRERVVEPLTASGEHDVIVFDCNPSWTDTVTGAIASTDILVSPLGCDINSLKAASIFVELLDEFQEEMRHSFAQFFIVPTLVENNKLSQQILAKYRIEYENLCTVSAVRRTVTVQEANVLGKSLLETAFQSAVYQDFVGALREVNEAMLAIDEYATEDSAIQVVA